MQAQANMYRNAENHRLCGWTTVAATPYTVTMAKDGWANRVFAVTKA